MGSVGYRDRGGCDDADPFSFFALACALALAVVAVGLSLTGCASNELDDLVLVMCSPMAAVERAVVLDGANGDPALARLIGALEGSQDRTVQYHLTTPEAEAQTTALIELAMAQGVYDPGGFPVVTWKGRHWSVQTAT